MSGVRLVAMTQEQRDALARASTQTSYALNTVLHLWDAAPSDPEQSADLAIENHIVVENGTWSSLSIARAVLAALGWEAPHE